jgi:hypothetical protein
MCVARAHLLVVQVTHTSFYRYTICDKFYKEDIILPMSHMISYQLRVYDFSAPTRH